MQIIKSVLNSIKKYQQKLNKLNPQIYKTKKEKVRRKRKKLKHNNKEKLKIKNSTIWCLTLIAISFILLHNHSNLLSLQ